MAPAKSRYCAARAAGVLKRFGEPSSENLLELSPEGIVSKMWNSMMSGARDENRRKDLARSGVGEACGGEGLGAAVVPLKLLPALLTSQLCSIHLLLPLAAALG